MEPLRRALKILVIQEVRLMRLEGAASPRVIIEEMSQSIQETKGRVTDLVRLMEPGRRNALLRELIEACVDEEIELVVDARRNRCLRCVHVRYVDEEGISHRNLPHRSSRAQSIECVKMPPDPGSPCQDFMERRGTRFLEDYLHEMEYFYEVQEMFDHFREIWEEYFLNP